MLDFLIIYAKVKHVLVRLPFAYAVRSSCDFILKYTCFLLQNFWNVPDIHTSVMFVITNIK
jgi:hypothetical protein